jgi:hypothetical protein
MCICIRAEFSLIRQLLVRSVWAARLASHTGLGQRQQHASLAMDLQRILLLTQPIQVGLLLRP